MMTMMRWSGGLTALLMLLMLLMLGSCGSSPKTHYYTLSVAAAPVHAFSIASPVQLAAVHLPDTLDRREMVSHTGPNTLRISDESRWSAPLGEMTRRVLSQDLARYLPGKVVMPESAAPPSTSKIVVTVAQFAPGVDGQVALVASWSLLGGETMTPTLRRDVSLATDRRGSGADADAATMSELLDRLAQSIAETLAQARR